MFLNHFKNFYPGVGRDRLIEVAAHLPDRRKPGVPSGQVPLSESGKFVAFPPNRQFTHRLVRPPGILETA